MTEWNYDWIDDLTKQPRWSNGQWHWDSRNLLQENTEIGNPKAPLSNGGNAARPRLEPDGVEVINWDQVTDSNGIA
jgi:hypothetical protein